MNGMNQRLEPSTFGSFNENRGRFPPEQLLPYTGQYVAWSLDGTRILTNANSEEELEQKLVAAGIDPSQVVGEFFPDTDSVLL
jgi:hypothetical protein